MSEIEYDLSDVEFDAQQANDFFEKLSKATVISIEKYKEYLLGEQDRDVEIALVMLPSDTPTSIKMSLNVYFTETNELFVYTPTPYEFECEDKAKLMKELYIKNQSELSRKIFEDFNDGVVNLI
jgi:hypothetical protein